MRILKGKKEVAQAEGCFSLWKKARGLMFSRKRNLLFVFKEPQRVSLHMLFVFFPIWAAYLDERKEVLYVQKLIPFFSTFAPEQRAKYVLELVRKPEIKKGDRLTWKAA